MKESHILIVMETKNMNKANSKAEYKNKSSRVYSFKAYDFKSLCLFVF